MWVLLTYEGRLFLGEEFVFGRAPRGRSRFPVSSENESTGECLYVCSLVFVCFACFKCLFVWFVCLKCLFIFDRLFVCFCMFVCLHVFMFFSGLFVCVCLSLSVCLSLYVSSSVCLFAFMCCISCAFVFFLRTCQSVNSFNIIIEKYNGNTSQRNKNNRFPMSFTDICLCIGLNT